MSNVLLPVPLVRPKVRGTPDNELFKRTKVEVVGVSADPVDKQKAFVDKQKLTVRA